MVRSVARAWIDPGYKKRCSPRHGGIAELGYSDGRRRAPRRRREYAALHNLVVCTLCSCYPWTVLGLPPVWYKSAAYRSRAVIDPRGVLREFGLELADDVEMRVWDRTAEVRYLVIPERPAGTEHLSDEALAALVTRDAMVGVAKIAPPRRRAARDPALEGGPLMTPP